MLSVDIGNFMEESLKRMPEPALGPKQIRREFLASTDPNLAENYHDDDQYFDPERLPEAMADLDIWIEWCKLTFPNPFKLRHCIWKKRTILNDHGNDSMIYDV